MSEWEIWKDWIITGKVLLSIFLFAVAYFSLFTLLRIITTGPLLWAERRLSGRIKVNKNLTGAIFKVLSVFRLLSMTEGDVRVKATRNTGDLVGFLEELKEEEEDEEVHP